MISQNLNITTTEAGTAGAPVKNPKINDFEDGLEYYSAINAGCQVIITEDISDFSFSEIPIYNSESFLETIS